MESREPNDLRQRRRASTAIKASLRDLRVELALLNHQIGGKLALKDIDLDCLDVPRTVRSPRAPSRARSGCIRPP